MTNRDWVEESADLIIGQARDKISQGEGRLKSLSGLKLETLSILKTEESKVADPVEKSLPGYVPGSICKLARVKRDSLKGTPYTEGEFYVTDEGPRLVAYLYLGNPKTSLNDTIILDLPALHNLVPEEPGNSPSITPRRDPG